MLFISLSKRLLETRPGIYCSINEERNSSTGTLERVAYSRPHSDCPLGRAGPAEASAESLLVLGEHVGALGLEAIGTMTVPSAGPGCPAGVFRRLILVVPDEMRGKGARAGVPGPPHCLAPEGGGLLPSS